MSIDKVLNLVPVQKPAKANPIVARRQRLITRINQQISIVRAQKLGTVVTNGADNPRKLSSWYWMDETGRYFLAINYGKQPLEIAKGKFAIQCDTLAGVEDALMAVKDVLLKGDLDVILARSAKTIRDKFTK